MDWLTERLPEESDIWINSLTNSHTVLIIVGAQARALMDAASTRNSFAQADFLWMTAKFCFFGHVEVMVMADSFPASRPLRYMSPTSKSTPPLRL